MPQKSSIEWCDYTSNPIYFERVDNGKRGWFCTKVSDGCRNCYAETQNLIYNEEKNSGRGNGIEFKSQNAKLVKAVLNENELMEIIKLNWRLGKKAKSAKMFCFDMTDLFGDFIADEMRDKFFAVVAMCPNIYFQILTKRAEKMRDYFSNHVVSKHLMCDSFLCCYKPVKV